jgi:hypothetical protein
MKPMPERVPLRDADGNLLRFVSTTEARQMVEAGAAEPVGQSAVRYIRLKGAAARLNEGSHTTRKRGNTFEHIARRCNAYGPDARKEAA